MMAEEFNPDTSRMQQIEELCSASDALLRLRFGEDPELCAIAQARGDFFTTVICGGFAVDASNDPDAAVLRQAFSKLTFIFTDPNNYIDTPTTQEMIGLMDGFWTEVIESGRSPTLSELAGYYDALASSAYFVELNLRTQGQLDNLSADGRMAVVKTWLDLAAQPEAAEPPH